MKDDLMFFHRRAHLATMSILSPLFEIAHPKTAYLTGLRFYAAFMVFLIHSGGGGLRDLGGHYNQFVDDGKWGVIVFYVLSGFVISLSLLKYPTIDYKHYFSRRFLRIFPAYFVCLVIMCFLPITMYWEEKMGVPHDLLSVVYHMTFYNLIDQRYAVNGLGVDWSIPVEFFFYVFLPLFAVLSRRWVGIACIPLVAFFIYKSSIFFPNLLPNDFSYLHKHFLPQTYTIFFVIPFIMAWGYKRYSGLIDQYSGVISYGAMAIIIAMLVLRYGFTTMISTVNGREFYAVIAALCIIAGFSKNIFIHIFCENKFAIWMGNISFSFYLIHFPVLVLLRNYHLGIQEKFFTAFFITVILSSVMYLAVERPCLRWNRVKSQ